jgi:hypothetical protein
MPHLIIYSSLLGVLMVRLLRNRKEKRNQKMILQELEESQLTEEAAVAEFGAMNSPIVMVDESFFDTNESEKYNDLDEPIA